MGDFMRRVLLLLITLVMIRAQLNTTVVASSDIYVAFANVFRLRDSIEDGNTPVLRQAVLELEKMGISSDLSNLCELSGENIATILMKAAYAEYIIGLRDPSDWSIVVANAESGQLERQRSFSSTRFAVIESLLLISVVALGRVLWLRNEGK